MLSRIALVIAAVALVCAVAEAVLRALPAGVVVEADIYRMEDGLLLLKPSVERRHVTPRWDVTLRTNRDGWRDFEDGPVQGDTLIAGLGDSLAMGWGVELEETFYARLEARPPPAPRIRLVKAAVPGTGPSDHALVLARLLREWRPRVVVLALFVGNDFVDVARGGSAQYEVVDGFLAHVGSSAGWRKWAIRSRILQLLRAAQFRLGLIARQERNWDTWMREYAQVHLKDPPAETVQAIGATLLALDDVATQCEQAEARLLLVALPRSLQVDEQELAEMRRVLDWPAEVVDLDRPQRILAEWAARRGVALVDPLPAFREHARRKGDPLFYSPDAHMTPAGHRVTALAIAPALDALLR